FPNVNVGATHWKLLELQYLLAMELFPIPNTDAKIVDPETKQDLSAGEVGELAVKGPQVMKGYWNLEKETKAVLADGWLFTGDMAKMDEDGYFYIVDRKKDMIIAGGFNIYPREIEEVLYEHDKIEEAAVVGVQDEYRGETVKAFVVLKENASMNEKEVIAYCREKLAAYKAPRSVEFRESLPKSNIGKVLKRVLLEEEPRKTDQPA
ncbi:AMP-binding protein, partial [bacterium]|nr:AMP-binding protein [bacterium]